MNEFKQIIIVRKDLRMGVGKTAAQAAHASVAALEKTQKEHPQWAEEWKNTGQEKVVLRAQSKKELLELFEKLRKKFPAVLIKDAGRTQIASGEPTCIGVGPVQENLVDELTRELKLL